jgi:hypothetical protein
MRKYTVSRAKVRCLHQHFHHHNLRRFSTALSSLQKHARLLALGLCVGPESSPEAANCENEEEDI